MPSSWRLALLLAVLVVTTRLTLLAAVGFQTGGEELADDVYLHMQFIKSPFALLLGLRPAEAQYPPFLPLLEAAAARPLLIWLPDFYAIRIAFLIYEALTAFVFGLLLGQLEADPRARRWLGLAFVVLPIGWMTSVVMAEDEVIPALFLAVVLWSLARGRPWLALITCSLGVVAAKVFLLVPLAALILFLPVSTLIRRAMVAGLPLVLTYGAVYGPGLMSSGAIPLAAFTPETAVNVNIWAAFASFGVSPDATKRIASLLTASVLLALLAARWRLRPGITDTRDAARLFSALLLWVFVLSYHVNPEYYLLVLVPLLLVSNTKRWLGFLLVLFALPWAVNLFFGLHVFSTYGGAPGKAPFLDLYDAWLGIPPERLHAIALALSIAATLTAALTLTQKALGHHSDEGSR